MYIDSINNHYLIEIKILPGGPTIKTPRHGRRIPGK